MAVKPLQSLAFLASEKCDQAPSLTSLPVDEALPLITWNREEGGIA